MVNALRAALLRVARSKAGGRCGGAWIGGSRGPYAEYVKSAFGPTKAANPSWSPQQVFVKLAERWRKLSGRKKGPSAAQRRAHTLVLRNAVKENFDLAGLIADSKKGTASLKKKATQRKRILTTLKRKQPLPSRDKRKKLSAAQWRKVYEYFYHI